MNEKGFTLIEMLIVLLVISILLIITVPNVVSQQKSINDKGCEAYVKMVQGQVYAYKLDHKSLPNSLDALKDASYIESTTCPNGDTLQISSDGKVSAKP